MSMTKPIVFRLHSNMGEVYEAALPDGSKEYWMRIHAVEGWPTDVRISKKMYEQLQSELLSTGRL